MTNYFRKLTNEFMNDFKMPEPKVIYKWSVKKEDNEPLTDRQVNLSLIGAWFITTIVYYLFKSLLTWTQLIILIIIVFIISFGLIKEQILKQNNTLLLNKK